jgi:hypothetical protein
MNRTSNEFKLVFGRLKDFGLLLESDPKLPSVCTLITGKPMKGSWWAHPLAQTIFQVNELLDDHPDLVITKLLAGKVTFVHRRIWPELFAVATSKARWQTDELSDSAQTILKLVGKQGPMRSDELPINGVGRQELNNSVRQLERRLLIHSKQVHTASGAHAKLLETWQQWAREVKLSPGAITAIDARKSLERRVQELNERFNGKSTLPWQ